MWEGEGGVVVSGEGLRSGRTSGGRRDVQVSKYSVIIIFIQNVEYHLIFSIRVIYIRKYVCGI